MQAESVHLEAYWKFSQSEHGWVTSIQTKKQKKSRTPKPLSSTAGKWVSRDFFLLQMWEGLRKGREGGKTAYTEKWRRL